MTQITPRGLPSRRTAARAALGLLAPLALAGCIGVQPPGDAAPMGLDAARSASSAQDAQAARVRWGGTVVSLVNGADGNTTVELVSRPLDPRGRPVRNDRSDGRFRAVFEGLLDPAIVKSGRDMTVLGTLDGVQGGTIGETPYDFPLVRVEDHRYWRTVATVVDPCHTRWANHGFGYHQHDTFYCGTPFGRSYYGRLHGPHHGPWLSDWPHPFHRHDRGRRGSGVRLNIGIGG